MKGYRYYTRFRPPMPGAIPKEGLTQIASFDYPQTFEGVCGRVGAWGWAEYNRPLSEKEVDEYELVPSCNNPLDYH